MYAKNIDFNSKVKVKHITMPLCDVFKVRKHVRSLHCSTLITPQKILKTQLPPQKKNKSYQEKKHQTNKTAVTKKNFFLKYEKDKTNQNNDQNTYQIWQKRQLRVSRYLATDFLKLARL